MSLGITIPFSELFIDGAIEAVLLSIVALVEFVNEDTVNDVLVDIISEDAAGYSEVALVEFTN